MSTEAKNQGHPGDARYLRPSPSRGSTRRSEQHHAAGGPTRAQPRGNRTKKRREFGFAWRIFGASRETGTPAGSGGPRKPERNPRTAKWAQQVSNLRPLPCEDWSEGWQSGANFGRPRFPSEIDEDAMVGPGSVSPAVDKSLLHFCCMDSEQRRSPFSRMGMRNSSIRFRPRGELPIAPPAVFSVRDVARRLRVSTATVYRLCERGELHHVRLSNAIRIAPRDLELLLRRKA